MNLNFSEKSVRRFSTAFSLVAVGIFAFSTYYVNDELKVTKKKLEDCQKEKATIQAELTQKSQWLDLASQGILNIGNEADQAKIALADTKKKLEESEKQVAVKTELLDLLNQGLKNLNAEFKIAKVERDGLLAFANAIDSANAPKTVNVSTIVPPVAPPAPPPVPSMPQQQMGPTQEPIEIPSGFEPSNP